MLDVGKAYSILKHAETFPLGPELVPSVNPTSVRWSPDLTQIHVFFHDGRGSLRLSGVQPEQIELYSSNEGTNQQPHALNAILFLRSVMNNTAHPLYSEVYAFLNPQQHAHMLWTPEFKDESIVKIIWEPDWPEGFRFSFECEGVLLGWNSSKIPRPFRIHQRKSGEFFQEDFIKDDFIRFLNDHDEPFELFLRTSEGLIECHWDSEVLLDAQCVFRRTPAGVQIERSASWQGKSVKRLIVVAEFLAADLDRGVMGRIAGVHRWDSSEIFWEKKTEEIPRLLRGGFERIVKKTFPVLPPSVQLTAQDFNEKSPIYENLSETKWLDSLTLEDANGQIEKGLFQDLNVRVVFLKDPNPLRLGLRFEMGGKEAHLRGLLHAASFLWPENPEFSSGRTSRKHVQFLSRLALASSKEERELVLNEHMGEFTGKRKLMQELKNSFSEFERRWSQSHIVQLLSGEDKWIVASVNWHEVLTVLSLAAQYWGDSIRNAAYGEEISLSRQEVMANLGEFKKQLSGFGAEILFDQKLLRTVPLEFAIRAGRGAGQDWFEIHPEVRHGAEALSDDELRSIIESGGFWERKDLIQMVDENSMSILEKLAAILKKDKKESASGYLQIPSLHLFDWIALRKLGVKVEIPEEDERIIQRLINFDNVEACSIPSGFDGKLRDYQKTGYNWLSFLYSHKLGACLADDMGLGKTIQAIAFFGGLKEGLINTPWKDSNGPHLIVVPASLIYNWESEIKKFYPDFRVYIYAGADRKPDFLNYDICITSYDILKRDTHLFANQQFHVAVFDEAQMIKNIHSARAKAARGIRARFKLCLTGTPLENHMGEYFSVLDLCLPGLFGDYESFKTFLQSKQTNVIINRSRPFVLRRTKDLVLNDLPPKMESEVYLPMTVEQKALYLKVAQDVKEVMSKAYRNQSAPRARMMALTGILRLRQLCVSPKLIYPDFKGESPKLDYLIEKLNELFEEGHSSLVFSQFTKFLDLLQPELEKRKFNFYRLDGKTPLKKRKKMVESFQEATVPSVFLISLKAGGFGLNLTKANYVFHLDPWWNPAADRQASDRAHRLGQTQKVYIQKIFVKNSIEGKVMALRSAKWELFQSLMDEGEIVKKTSPVTKEDFEFLINTSEETVFE